MSLRRDDSFVADLAYICDGETLRGSIRLFLLRRPGRNRGRAGRNHFGHCVMSRQLSGYLFKPHPQNIKSTHNNFRPCCCFYGTPPSTSTMADALRKIEDHLTCTICHETYTNPKRLQCNHVFCEDCLEELQTQNSLKCPTCREQTYLSVGDGLQDAFRTTQILDIVSEHKKKLDENNNCHQHPNRELELYCEECKSRICLQCTIQQHHGHKYNLISEILKPAEEQLTLIKDTLEKNATASDEIKDQKTAIKAEIEKNSNELRAIIKKRESKLISKLNAVTQEKLHELSLQRKQITVTQAKLKQRLELLKEDIRPRDEEKSLVDKVTELTTEFGPEIIEPSTEADMKFSSSDVASEACDAHGLVSAPTVPEPSQCHAISEVPTVTTVGEKSITLIQVNTHKGKPLEKSIQSLECVLVSELTGAAGTGGSAERKGPSQYEVSYQPTIKGRHQLHIKVMREHIKGSPYSVVAKSSVDKLGTVMKSISLPKNHLGVTINLCGEVVMIRSKFNSRNISIHNCYCDTIDCVALHNTQAQASVANSVFVSSNEYEAQTPVPASKPRSFGIGGTLQSPQYRLAPEYEVQTSVCEIKLSSKPRSFGTGGMCPSPQVIQPSGVTIDGEGNIYVANSKRQKHKVQKFTAQGEFLAEVGTEGSRDLQFNQVRGIAFNASNNKIYVVDENHHVQVLNSDLTFSCSFGKFGKYEEEFASPSGIACDSTGNVYVADSGNNRIQVFTSAGKFMRMFGSRGKGTGELDTPMGIALDVDGNIYVSESNNHRVSVFTSEGHFVTSLGQEVEEEEPGELTRPCGLAVDSSGVVYVCDRDNDRLQLF